MELVISTLEQGMIYGIMALGVYITYKILDFPDLTVDGSFPMGAAITAVMITNGDSGNSYASGVFPCRSAGRCTDWSDPCKAQGKRPAERHHYDDRSLHRQFADRRQGEPSVL